MKFNPNNQLSKDNKVILCKKTNNFTKHLIAKTLITYIHIKNRLSIIKLIHNPMILTNTINKSVPLSNPKEFNNNKEETVGKLKKSKKK